MLQCILRESTCEFLSKIYLEILRQKADIFSVLWLSLSDWEVRMRRTERPNALKRVINIVGSLFFMEWNKTEKNTMGQLKTSDQRGLSVWLSGRVYT
jgi:gluconate kinase